jgi:hypothetical protein
MIHVELAAGVILRYRRQARSETLQAYLEKL